MNKYHITVMKSEYVEVEVIAKDINEASTTALSFAETQPSTRKESIIAGFKLLEEGGTC